MNEFQPEGRPRRVGRPTNEERIARDLKVAADAAEAFAGSSTSYQLPDEPGGDIVHTGSIRETRSEEVRRERRRRADTGPTAGMKLNVPAALLDPNFEYRWIDADQNRVHAKTVLDDWDVVTTPAIDGTGEGAPVSRIVGKDASGQPKRNVLVRKPKDWYMGDKAKEQAAITTREKDIRRGVVNEAGSLKGETAYVPDRHEGFSTNEAGRNVIGRE